MKLNALLHPGFQFFWLEKKEHKIACKKSGRMCFSMLLRNINFTELMQVSKSVEI